MERNNIDSEIDILLTYPKDGLRFFQSMVPYGLLSIATVLKRAGYRVALIDFNHYRNDFRRQLKHIRPKIVGIGGTTTSRSGSFLTARLVKEVLPETVVVYGGNHATFTASETLRGIKEIDYIIKGEGEISFLHFCDELFGGRGADIHSIPGVCYRDRSGIVESKAHRIQDLCALPIPDRGLLGDNYSFEMEFVGGRGDFIMTSRGCPASCNFCSASKMFPGGVRVRPIDAVMREVEQILSRKNISGLKLFDSTFTANRQHVEEFCSRIKQFKLPWECEIRADTVDADLLRRMKESGCYYINIGMETSSNKHLKQISKGITPSQVLDVLSVCRRLDIRSKVFFTFGHMGQTFRECMDDIRFIERNKTIIDFFAVTVGMRIYPGTRLEKQCREKEILPKAFSWTNRIRTPLNLFVLEPGNIPILFQKQLGALRLLAILILLFCKKLICTDTFLKRMIGENIKGVITSVKLGTLYSMHRVERKVGRDLGERAWDGISR